MREIKSVAGLWSFTERVKTLHQVHLRVACDHVVYLQSSSTECLRFYSDRQKLRQIPSTPVRDVRGWRNQTTSQPGFVYSVNVSTQKRRQILEDYVSANGQTRSIIGDVFRLD